MPRPTSSEPVGLEPAAQLEHLYDQFADGIHGWCRGMLGSLADADDAIQSIWLKLARQGDQLTSVKSPEAYLWTLTRNHVRSLLRRRRLERLWTPALDDKDDEPPASGDSQLSREERQDLYRAVASLSDRMRAVVLLVAFEGCTLEEAALRLGIPRGTAASRYHSAMGKLQKKLKPSEPLPRQPRKSELSAEELGAS